MAEKQLERNDGATKFGYIESKRAFLFPDISDYINVVAVTTVSQAVTVPSWANYCILCYKGDVAIAIRPTSPAAFPSGAVTDGSGSMINPTQFGVGGLSNFYIIGEDATVVSVSFYK